MKTITLLIMALLFAKIVYSQEPVPSTLPTGTNEQKHTRHTANESNSNNRGTEQNPVFIKEISSDISAEKRDAEAKDREQKASYERWTTISTVIIAAFTVILGISTVLLWVETKKTARFTGLTAKTMQETAKKELRAYVFAIPDKDMDHGYYWYRSVPLIIRNFGKTPAYKCATSLYIGVFKYPLENPISNMFDHASLLATSARPVLAPGGHVRQYTQHIDLDFSQIDGIKGRQYAIFISSEVVYIDAFGEQHTTRACFYSIGEDFGKGLLANYHEGNEEAEG